MFPEINVDGEPIRKLSMLVPMDGWQSRPMLMSCSVQQSHRLLREHIDRAPRA